jgi:hypothetical protein
MFQTLVKNTVWLSEGDNLWQQQHTVQQTAIKRIRVAPD